ncbi:quaternary ammonium compound-resistance protein SugE [Halogeometricum rufum]|uniref:Quaternary ammonium compound-resistance protein SugE n=1 Tax=Halogeometricum rufum TaxID=553469 RepID=A0A1I6FXB7_9EURY|nr:SMR family transporter [Halogeometricum rufum]MUV59058.1 ligand-binding protein SH3 [Halogeometricum sp. CBA1124]SFR34541.1 quaternary ammonium compound-resistance protein SugE [Halogeometricum rufum]
MKQQTAWLVLVGAAFFETAWAVGLEYADGFSNLRATAFVVVALVVSMAGLAKAVEVLPVGTAYAVWTGIGAVGTVLVGIALFDESTSPVRLLCLVAIVAGVVGLRFAA